MASFLVCGAGTAPLFDAFRRDARSLDHSALFTNASLNLSGSGEPERVPAARVSAELFNLLGVQPRLGRAFTAAESKGRPDADALAGKAEKAFEAVIRDYGTCKNLRTRGVRPVTATLAEEAKN